MLFVQKMKCGQLKAIYACTLEEKIPKLNYIHLNLFLVSSENSVKFFCKMSVTFDFGQDVLCLSYLSNKTILTQNKFTVSDL